MTMAGAEMTAYPEGVAKFPVSRVERGRPQTTVRRDLQLFHFSCGPMLIAVQCWNAEWLERRRPPQGLQRSSSDGSFDGP